MDVAGDAIGFGLDPEGNPNLFRAWSGDVMTLKSVEHVDSGKHVRVMGSDIVEIEWSLPTPVDPRLSPVNNNFYLLIL